MLPISQIVYRPQHICILSKNNVLLLPSKKQQHNETPIRYSKINRLCQRVLSNWKSQKYRELYGVTDGKAIGTFVEHRFQDYLEKRYDMTLGSSAIGLDLPSVNCDIKVTSLKRPQSSCPFKSSKQKIYGLGYNLIIFVYVKHDDARTKTGRLEFVSCTFIDRLRTGDYQTTKGIRDIIDRNGNQDDLFAYLIERHIP